MTVADRIAELFAQRGSGAYYGEAVSMREHGLQAAHFARLAKAPDALVLAALLHDIGHLVQDVPDDLADWTTDAQHEVIGADWLARYFDPDICDPVRLHVPAKRYLCATNANYFSKLSEASVHTLKLQGGPMSSAEVEAFQREPHWREAIQVRYWDEAGKVAGLAVDDLDWYRPMMEKAARSG